MKKQNNKIYNKIYNFIFNVIAVLAISTIPLTQNAIAMTKKEIIQSVDQNINQEDQGRDFSVLSFNKDGSELMFNECFDARLINKDAKDGEKECGVFRLNLDNHNLRHYEFPERDKYYYSNASFSPSGNYVVLNRIPKFKFDKKLSYEENENATRQRYEQIEIAFMKSDGTDFKVIKTSEGLKAGTIMSNDETKIAYVTAKLRKPGSKTLAAHFDILEIDLKNKTNKLFAGPYQFYETGQMQYLEGDKEILMHAWGPLNEDARGGVDTHDYNKKHSNSSIFKISRGAEGLLEPMVFEGFINVSDPFIAKSKSIYFYGQEIKTGLRLMKKDINNNILTWRPPSEMAGINRIFPTPDEKKVFILYIFQSGSGWIRQDVTKNGIAFLDTINSTWHKLSVPEVNSSKPISVISGGIIETNSPNELKNSLKKLPNFILTNPLNSKK